MSRSSRLLLLIALAAAWPTLGAPAHREDELPQVTVTGKAGEPVEKSYRRMLKGMDYFEAARASYAPDASLRFKLLPRKHGTDIDHIRLEVIGTSFDYELPVAADHTFELKRDPLAAREDAVVSPNRKRQTMTWRTEIRTPGVPAGARRLGDLRLECLVGMEAGLVSGSGALARLAGLFTDSRSYCTRENVQYLFFAERPLFSVSLMAGDRREVLPIDRLYAGASDDPGLARDLPDCDCEVLVDRTYFLPLGDPGWPNDTLVQFEYMDEGTAP